MTTTHLKKNYTEECLFASTELQARVEGDTARICQLTLQQPATKQQQVLRGARTHVRKHMSSYGMICGRTNSALERSLCSLNWCVSIYIGCTARTLSVIDFLNFCIITRESNIIPQFVHLMIKFSLFWEAYFHSSFNFIIFYA